MEGRWEGEQKNISNEQFLQTMSVYCPLAGAAAYTGKWLILMAIFLYILVCAICKPIFEWQNFFFLIEPAELFFQNTYRKNNPLVVNL